MRNMYTEALNRLPEILKRDLDENLCVCNDVIKMDVIRAIVEGADTLEEVQRRTYASDGNGCCAHQVEKLIEYLCSPQNENEHQ